MTRERIFRFLHIFTGYMQSDEDKLTSKKRVTNHRIYRQNFILPIGTYFRG